jgi:cytidylate kinase
MSDTHDLVNDLAGGAKVRMQRWLASPGLKSHLEKAIDTGHRPTKTGPYIAISREAGTGGAQIARSVAQSLGWDLLDKELLDFMAESYGVPRSMLEFVDETRANWLQDVLSSWIDSRVVSHEKFVMYLERMIYLAAMHGRVVFVGRGAQCILPSKSGLSVRLVAPLDFRLSRRMERRGIDRKLAKQQVEQADADQLQFYERFFHRNAREPHGYDLCINVASFSQQTVSDLIVDAYRKAECETTAV